MPWTALRRDPLARVAGSQRQALRRLLTQVRYELIPLKDAQARAHLLPAQASVSVTASPAHGMEATLALAEWLQARAHRAMPHLSARLIRDRAHLSDLLQRARQTGITQAFVVGGDPGPTEGLRDGVTLLRAMHEIGHPFQHIGVPAYPEGHPAISGEVLLDALRAKSTFAHSMTTQMSFDAEAVSSWIVRTRGSGITLPLYLGVPGVLEPHRLVSIAGRIGVAGSARFLTKNRGLVRALLRPRAFTPESLLASLAPAIAAPEAAIAGLHLFTFNQVAPTVAWIRQAVERLE
jgi:methylenetetrahydrofolate reductase (NADPH)